ARLRMGHHNRRPDLVEKRGACCLNQRLRFGGAGQTLHLGCKERVENGIALLALPRAVARPLSMLFRLRPVAIHFGSCEALLRVVNGEAAERSIGGGMPSRLSARG